VGFLRRVLGGSKGSSTATPEVSPDWAASLSAQDFEYLAWLVQSEVGTTRIPDVRMVRDVAIATELGLPRLLVNLAWVPTDDWPAVVHAFFDKGTVQPGGPGERALLAELAPLAAAELGPELVPDPSLLTDPWEGGKVNLRELAAVVQGRPRSEWPLLVHGYYLAASDMIRRGAELERRADSLDAARPFLEEMWRPEADGEGVARVSGPIDGTSRWLMLNDAAAHPQTIRAIGERRLAEIGGDPEAGLQIVRDRVRATAVRRLPPDPDHPLVIGLDLSPHVWSMTVIECLDAVAPEAIGPLGTLVTLLAHNVVIARPIGFDDGIRDDFKALCYNLATQDASSALPSPGPFWRRAGNGALFTIDVTTTIRDGGQKVSMNLADERFRGVLMASEPTVELPLPDWCVGVLDGAHYTRFAGLVAAHSTPPPMPEIVGEADPEVLRVLARRCALARLEVWPLIIGLTHRLAIRWTPGGAPTPTTSNLASPADAVRTKAAPLMALLAETVEPMADVLRACLYFAASLRVTGPDESVLEAEVIALVALAKKADVVAATDRLIVALAEKLPLGMFGIVELAAPDDPRFADVEHVVPLR
jgi:hypothetical protein